VKLRHMMTFRVDLQPPINIGRGPVALRRIFDVRGGTFKGPRLSGIVRPGGGDWLQIGSDGLGRLDVRLTLTTDDGVHIYVQYLGLVDLKPVAEKLARAETTEFGETYFLITPRFETGDERYQWINRIVAVGEGRNGPGWVEYRVYEIVNDQLNTKSMDVDMI
jgi:hypothetical protein